MKSALLLAILTAFAGNLAEGPNKGPTDHKTEVAQQAPTNPSPVTVVVENSQRGEPAQSPKPEAISGNTAAEWALVVVGIVTCGVIGWQSLETRRSAQAMRESTNLQRAGMRQWIDVEPKGIDFNAVVCHPFKVEIAFLAINNTDYPLTVTKIETKVSVRAEEWEVFTVETYQTVPPRSSKDNTYPFYFPMKSADYVGGRSDWREKRILTINGTISFRDCLERLDTQEFSGLYHCDPTGVGYMKPLGIVPNQHTEREERKAN